VAAKITAKPRKHKCLRTLNSYCVANISSQSWALTDKSAVPDHRLEDEETKCNFLLLWATDRKASYHGDAAAAVNCVHEFCDITPCSSLKVNKLFGGKFRLHLHRKK
jgi:hypothetical protein